MTLQKEYIRHRLYSALNQVLHLKLYSRGYNIVANEIEKSYLPARATIDENCTDLQNKLLSARNPLSGDNTMLQNENSR